jgi:D-xylonolactonase
MTFSLDERSFFHTDSLAYRITRYAYDRGTGEISSPAVHYQGQEEEGLPDGITIDREGCLWSAFWGASAVRRLDPEGRPIQEVRIPARQPSSVMFGGAALDQLYVTSAAQGAADLATGLGRDGVFLGGPVYRFSPGVAGRAEWPADL